ncbi:hypothetical protein JL722_8628 [Aureococcus anophagefferens]|nr:hypothetical protein JL722_8628 [Aureococcus anophagefferens]
MGVGNASATEADIADELVGYVGRNVLEMNLDLAVNRTLGWTERCRAAARDDLLRRIYSAYAGHSPFEHAVDFTTDFWFTVPTALAASTGTRARRARYLFQNDVEADTVMPLKTMHCTELPYVLGFEGFVWRYNSSDEDAVRDYFHAPTKARDEGEVVGLPKPPSKWIDVHVCDGRVIKFQSSALRVGRVPDAETRPPKISLSLSLRRARAAAPMQPRARARVGRGAGSRRARAASGRGHKPSDDFQSLRHAATTSRAAAAAQYSANDDGESDEEAESSKVSHAQSLKRGTQVTIHRTENVQQRAPHLIGRIGTIKEVPQHPNTWFKVQFADRRVCTFRPSALRRVANGAGDPAKRKPGKGKDLSDDELETKATKSKDRGARLLSSVLTGRAVDAERWVGMYVRIRVGRLGGQIGRILRSGNGWVQLRTTRGEIAKRAYELELVPEGESLPTLKDGSRHARRRRPPGRDDDDDASGGKPKEPAAAAAAAARGAADGAARPQLLSGRLTSTRGSSSAKQATYRDTVRKHVERARDKYRDRPNLEEWLEKLQGGPWDCNESSGGAYRFAYLSGSDDSDDDAPLLGPRWATRAARREKTERASVAQPGCVLCRQAKDPHGTCWNAQCVASPLFVGLLDDAGRALRCAATKDALADAAAALAAEKAAEEASPPKGNGPGSTRKRPRGKDQDDDAPPKRSRGADGAAQAQAAAAPAPANTVAKIPGPAPPRRRGRGAARGSAPATPPRRRRRAAAAAADAADAAPAASMAVDEPPPAEPAAPAAPAGDVDMVDAEASAAPADGPHEAKFRHKANPAVAFPQISAVGRSVAEARYDRRQSARAGRRGSPSWLRSSSRVSDRSRSPPPNFDDADSRRGGPPLDVDAGSDSDEPDDPCESPFYGGLGGLSPW